MIELAEEDRAFLEAARRATLATTGPNGRPRLVPVCFALDPRTATLWIALDEKPKRDADPRTLARVRDVLARPDVDLLVDHWSEDWSQLAWLRLAGRASLVEPGSVPPGMVARFRTRYPQYATHDLESRPMLAIVIETATGWRA